jgi:Raf kinase inhibitor-like YbhB/YbcL family protein
MKIESPAFEPSEMIPSEHTCDGNDLSPPLAWTEPPANTASLALICDDPDAGSGTWVHWLVWNIPPAERRLAKGIAKSAELPGGARQGTSDFRRLGYGGPCPPSGTHRYFFRLFALDSTLDLAAGATREELERAMRGHVLDRAELMGKYRRS